MLIYPLFFLIVLITFLQEYCPNPENYGRHVIPLEQSKPKISLEDLLEATKPMDPLPFNNETDMKVLV